MKKLFIVLSIFLLPLTASAQNPEQCWNPEKGIWQPKDPTASCPSFTLESKFYVDPQTGLKLTVLENFAFTNVRFEISTPAKDFNGGLVWRYANLENHYGAIVNLTKRELEVYKISDGKHITIKKAKLSAPKTAESIFEVKQMGDDIQFFYNGKLALQATDETFKNGKIGYWAKDGDQVHIKYGNII
jgi:hypothetical protein